jgi:CheY-like chemotaxis protein
MHMPDIDGWTLVEKTRQHPDLKRLKIMMLVSVGERGDAMRCRQLDIAAYLTQPIGPSQLLDSVLTVLSTKARETDPPRLVTRHTLREDQRSLRILLAEDNLVNQKLAARLVEKRGHTAVVVSSGREALQALEKQKFDLVLMDVQMPEMDGFETTAAIREKEKATGSHLPIIAMTAYAMKGDLERCLTAGMDKYIAKPIQPRELFEAIEGLVPAGTESRVPLVH